MNPIERALVEKVQRRLEDYPEIETSIGRELTLELAAEELKQALAAEPVPEPAGAA